MTEKVDWEIEVYPPPAPHWPYVVVTRITGKGPAAQFESTVERANAAKAEIHERLGALSISCPTDAAVSRTRQA